MSRKPDFILSALVKTTGVKSGKIGCAWKNGDGSITLALDAGTIIEHHKDVLFTLFPNDRSEEPPKPVIPGLSNVWRQPRIAP